MTAPSSSTASPDPSPTPESPSWAWRWGRRVLWGLGALFGTGLLLVGLLLLVLQTEMGATAAAQVLASRLNPLPNTTLTVDRASGTWVGSLRLTDVSLTRPDSTGSDSVAMAQIDTVAAQYRLGALLRGRLHLTSVALSGPSVAMRQASDSTWDWGRVLSPSEPPPSAPPPDTSAGMPIRIDQLRVDDGQFSAAFYAGETDSTARVQRLTLRARDLQLGPSYGGQLDTLGLDGHLPADPTPLHLATRGSLSASRLRIDTLRFSSPRSRVHAGGTARLPLGPNDSLDDVALSLRAAPLVLGDLTAFVPTLAVNPRETITLDAQLTGSGRRLTLATDAEVRNGGTLSARIEATPRTQASSPGDSLHYQVAARARRLSTSLLGPPDTTENALTATVEGRLRGPSLDALSGVVTARVRNTRLFGLSTSSLTLRSPVQDGTAEVDLQGALNGIALAVDGSARPFDAAPSADLTADVQHLDLAAVIPDAGLTGTVSASARIRADSIAAPGARYTVDATLRDARLGHEPIDGGRVSFALGPDQLSLDGDLRFPTGRLQLVGTAALDGSERFALDTGRFSRVDVAALLGDTTESRVTGTVRASGMGLSPETMQGRATVQVQEAQYGSHRLGALTTEVRLDAGQLTTETSAQLNGGTWALSATGRPFAAVPSFEVTEGRFQNVDIGPFLQDTTQSSSLQGTVRGRVRGTTLDTLRLDARLALGPSRINRQELSDAALDVTLRDSTLQSTLTLDTPTGTASIRATARPFDTIPRYRLSDGTFDNLDVGALAAVPGMETDLSGTLSLSGRGTALADLTLDSELRLRPSSINRARLSEGRLSLNAAQGRLTADGQLAVADGSVQVRGHLDSLGRAPRYALHTTAQSIDVSALAGLDSLPTTVHSARWSVEGRGRSLDSLSATTRLSADSVRVDQVRLRNLTVGGTLDGGLMRVDTLLARSNVGTLRGQGPLALTAAAGASKFNVRATITNGAPLRRLAGASTLELRKGVLDAHVYGAAGKQRFDGTLTLSGLIYDDVRLSDVTSSFNGRRGPSQLLEHLEVNADLGYVSAFGLTANQTRIESRLDGRTVQISTNLELDPTHTISLSTSFQPAADPLAIQLHALNARMGPDRWSLRRETTLTIGDTYRIDDLLLESGPQRIEANGVVSPTGRQDLQVAVEQMRLGGIAPLLELSGLGGTATGRLTLSGPASAPVFDGTLDLALRSQEKEVGTLQLDAGYDDLAVALDARLTHSDGRVLTLSGTVPTDLRLQATSPAPVSDQPVRLDAATEQFPINWIDPFLDPATVRSVTGTLTADAAIRGTLAEPDLSGTLSVADLGASLPTLETRYRDGTARLELDGDKLRLTESQVRTSNDGSLRVTGVVNFPELTVGEYDLTINASDFLAINTSAYREAVIDGQMTLRGTIQAPILDGSVQVESGSVYYTEALAETAGSLSTVSLSAQDQLTLEERFGIRLTAADTTTFDMYEALSMDLNVAIESDTWLRSNGTPELNVQFTGDLDVQKAPNEADPRIFGTIDVVGERSTLRQFGQEFQITEGTLTFNGDPYTPYLSLTAVYDQRARGTQGSEVRITLSLTGRPDDLSPELSSDPPMNTRNILSYLATGRPADALFSGGSEGGNIATQVALGQASNFVENLAASELGLDIVRLQVRPEGTSYLTVGRYLTPEFFVSIEQPVLTSSSQTSVQSTAFIPDVTLEYRFTDYLTLRSRSNQQSLQLNLLFEYAY